MNATVVVALGCRLRHRVGRSHKGRWFDFPGGKLGELTLPNGPALSRASHNPVRLWVTMRRAGSKLCGSELNYTNDLPQRACGRTIHECHKTVPSPRVILRIGSPFGD